MIEWGEFRAALAATRPYLLSHHEPERYHRCYAPSVGDRRVRLCARCLGVYPGIAVGVLAAVAESPLPTGFVAVAVLPLPALVDWAATSLTARRGWNSVRTATGAALGYAYGVGLVTLFLRGDLRMLGVGAIYGVAAAVLLAVHQTRQ